MSERRLHRLLALAMFLVPLVVYLMTMAATVSFWDSGEFIATSYIVGIPHSPGTPLYVLVGRVFTMLPLPLSIAQRVNFLSVVFSALASMMVYLVAVATLRFMYPSPKGGLGRFAIHAGAVTGSLFLAFSNTFWWDATEAEVYALSSFVMGLCTWLALVWYRNPAGHAGGAAAVGGKGPGAKVPVPEEMEGRHHARGLVYLIVYLLALGIGFHLGTILVFGGIFLLFLLVKEKAFSNAELVIFTFGLAVLLADMTLYRSSTATIAGLVIFAVLVAWAAKAKGKFALWATGVLALGLSVHLFLYIRSHLDPGIDMVDPETWKAMYAHLRREQYPPINVLERKASLWFQLGHFGRYFREQFRMTGDAYLGPFNLGQALTAVPVALGFLGIAANYVRERRTWALNVVNLLINSAGLLVFLNFSASEVRERDYFYGPAFYFFAVFIGIGAAWLLASIAEWAERKGVDRVRYVVPAGALCVVLSLLPIRHNWFTHDRSNNYMARDYAFNMLAGLEPDAIVFTNGDNDTYPLWYLQNVERFRTDVRVANLSLLNTDWYLRQLRDREPRVPFSLTDGEISRMRPVALKGGGIAWNRDQAVQRIISESNWKRPIYFAVTVPAEVWEPYERYLEMQGIVRRLVPIEGENRVNEALLARNLDEIYRFRGILTPDGAVDTTIYKDRDTRGMFYNFAIAAAQLGQQRAIAGDFDDAVRRMELSLKFDPSLKAAVVLLGTYYMMAGRDGDAIAHFIRAIREEPGEGEYWMRLARIYEFKDQLPFAMQNLNEGIRLAPDHRQLYIDAFRVAGRMGQADQAKGYLKQWVERHPEDGEMASILRGADRLLEEEFGLGGGAPPRGGDGE